MTPEEIDSTLVKLFGAGVKTLALGSWQVEVSQMRMLTLLSEDLAWLRVLVPIVSVQEAQPFLEQLLEANFDKTQETRYALHQGVVWGVFQHNLESLNVIDFLAAVERLLTLHQRGLSECFEQLLESRIRQIIQAAKSQGQSLEATLQMLDRFYQEGLMGEMDQGAESREAVLTTWRNQLERLWSDVKV